MFALGAALALLYNLTQVINTVVRMGILDMWASCLGALELSWFSYAGDFCQMFLLVWFSFVDTDLPVVEMMAGSKIIYQSRFLCAGACLYFALFGCCLINK